jgi:hypothetical protein
VVFGERCFEANHWRKKTAVAANSGGRDSLDDVPVCGINNRGGTMSTGECKLLLLQAFQTGRRATNELISIACHAAMSLRPAPGSPADLMASDPASSFRNSKYPRYITNSGWAHCAPAAALSFLQHRSLGERYPQYLHAGRDRFTHHGGR